MTRSIPSQMVLALLVAGAMLVIGMLPRSASAADGVNACGCREGAPGQCICEKKSRCGCPGECEPKGCEEKRGKQLEKEIQAETKKAEEAQRRQRVRQDRQDKEEQQPEPDRPSSSGGHKESTDHQGNSDGADKSPAAKKVRIVKMTPGQKRDLAKLIGAYLAEHPNDGGKAIDQIQSEIRK
jgi:hypothetical protein